MSKHILKRKPSCDSSLPDCILCLFCCSMEFSTFDMHGAYYTLILRLFMLKREKKDGIVGPLARIILKIIYYILHSVADFMHKLGQATYF